MISILMTDQMTCRKSRKKNRPGKKEGGFSRAGEYKMEPGTEKNRSAYAGAAVIAAGCMWGSMGLWVRRFSEKGLDSLQILALRAAVAAAVLGIFLLLYNRKLLQVAIKDFWCFLGTGICSLLFFGYCYNRTILLTSLSVAAILLYTAPAMVTVMSVFLFQEKMTRQKLAALLLAFAGCVLVTGVLEGTQAVSALGILTGLGSGFGYALYSIFSRFALKRGYHPLTVTFYTFVCTLAGTLPLADWMPIGTFLAGDRGNLLYTAAYGVVTTGLPYILYTTGLRYVENSKASIMATVEPVVATLIGVFILHERMTVSGAAGVVLVLFALVILSKEK